MNDKGEIEARIAATMAVADQVDQVAVPPGFAAAVMRRWDAQPDGQMRSLWLRPTLSVAAAVLVLAVNWFAITSLLSQRRSTTDQTDPLDQIRNEYSLTESEF